jgi:hypothetical protein
MGWRAWQLGGGLLLQLGAVRLVCPDELAIDYTIRLPSDEVDVARDDAAAILAALGRERSASR